MSTLPRRRKAVALVPSPEGTSLPPPTRPPEALSPSAAGSVCAVSLGTNWIGDETIRAGRGRPCVGRRACTGQARRLCSGQLGSCKPASRESTVGNFPFDRDYICGCQDIAEPGYEISQGRSPVLEAPCPQQPPCRYLSLSPILRPLSQRNTPTHLARHAPHRARQRSPIGS